MKIADVIRDLEQMAPLRLADEGDKIGLQVGNPQSGVTRIAVALDPTPSVVDSAVGLGAELLVCHHPLIYKPIETLAAGEPTQDSLIKLITAGTTLYVMHTNYDSADGGINDVLAERLGVNVTGLLAVRRPERKFKIAVFTPEETVDEVREAMTLAGAGGIGKYIDCSFRSKGTGTFRPLPGAEPYIGDIGALEEVAEYKLEMLVTEWRLADVIEAMLRAHPYEEVAYDVYPLANEPYAHGLGRVGTLEDAGKLSEFRRRVEDALDYKETRMIGDPDRVVKTVALCGGAGRSFIPDARAAGADVYVTGDVGHHDFLAADALGLAVIDASHYHTERPGMEALVGRLSRKYADEPVGVEFIG